jgi:hypothetical protein
MDTYDLDTDAELQQPSHNLSAPSQTPRPLPPKPATDIRRKPVTATPGRPAAHPLAPPAPLTTSAVSRPATHAAPKPTTRVAPRLTTPVSPRLTTPSAPKHATSTLPKVDTPVVSPRWRPSAYNPFCPFPPAPAVPSAVTATAVVVPPANPASTAFGSTLSVASAPALAPRNNMDDRKSKIVIVLILANLPLQLVSLRPTLLLRSGPAIPPLRDGMLSARANV